VAAEYSSRISVRTVAIGGCIILVFGALLALVWYSAVVLFLVFAGILFGVFLSALTDVLGRLIGGGHTLRLVLVCLLLAATLSTMVALGGTTIAAQVSELGSSIQYHLKDVRGYLERYGLDTSFLDPASQNENPATAAPAESSRTIFPNVSALASGTSAVVGRTFQVVAAIFAGVGNFFIVIFLGVLLAAQPQTYRAGLLHLVPHRHAT
jgi:predicted PurR-regulated permease PerM